MANLSVPRDLAYYNAARQTWVAPAGRYALLMAADAGELCQRLAVDLQAEWSEAA
ncbi:hypothetical protein [Martelella sp. FOR1707]